jgi:hypothetical protein
VLAACASPTTSPTPTQPPAPTLRPLPNGLGGIPGPDDASASITPHTPHGELQVGVAHEYQLPHCGLGSPIDIDGSLWNPVGGHDGRGGSLTEEQVADLINSTRTVVTLLDADTLEMHTDHGAVVVLERHEGARSYFLCM